MLLRRVTPLLAVLLLAGLLAAESTGAPAGDAARDPEAAAARGGKVRAVLRLRKTRFGKVIHEKRSGLVAYLFTSDRRRKSRCDGECARAWPPILTQGRPRAGSGLKQRRLGKIKRADGSKQVTYRGRPLYFYSDDRPGVILCNNVTEFGGDWFVVNKKGKPVP